MNKDFRKQYCYSLFKNFDKILSELQLVYNLNHSGEKGRESEEIIKAFLKEYMPNKYSITSGFIYSDLGISNQSDIIIYDPSQVSPFYSGYVNKVIHLISLRAVIECKMNLTDMTKLLKENEKFSNVKTLYRNDAQMKGLLNMEPLTVVFAFKSFGKRDYFIDRMNSSNIENIDIIFSADKGVYVYNKDERKFVSVAPTNFYGMTTDLYDASIEKHGFAIFFSYFLDHIDRIESDYRKFSRLEEYNKSSIYIDYIGK